MIAADFELKFGNPFKDDEQLFLFHLKSSSQPQDI